MQPEDIAHLFRLNGHQPAITSTEYGTVSYQELERRIQSALLLLKKLGLGQGDKLCLLSKNHPLWFELFFAALYSGIQFAPANWRLPANELSPLLADLDPTLIICSDEFIPTAQQALPSTALLSISEFTAQAAARPGDSWPASTNGHGDDCVMLLKTGGTTGKAKWARQRREQLWLNGVHTAKLCSLGNGSCIIQATPLFHAGANALATPALLTGGHVVLMREFDPTAYLQLVKAHRASLVFGVPTVYQMLLSCPHFNAKELPSIQWLLSGGAPCPRSLARQLADRGFTIKQGFGMTEAGVNCFTLATVASPGFIAQTSNMVGKPMPHAAMKIEDGELVISGKVIFGGYLSDHNRGAPSPTAVRTGDRFTVDHEGNYFVQGRSKEMYISGGENVFPLEVENHLADLPELAAVAVVGVTSDRWGETGLAACVLSSYIDPDSLYTKIRAFLATRLATYKHPRHLLILDALPLTSAGKVDKKAIAKQWK